MNRVIQKFPEIDYALIQRDSAYEPFIAAFSYSDESGTWRQGHYFDSILTASAYINRLIKERRN